ncbi:MAG: 30S ribosomal protein S12 methylthiotransferase RimO [Actinobacteria bacterium]|nr:30S ribosomal protein S12 methylthiotransferase RimO [Actinomycetota bacterium]
MSFFCLITLGCFRNEVESDNFRSALRSWGHEEVGSIEEADFIIVNSCGFISDACDEGIDTILKIDEITRSTEKHAPVIVAGCMSQRYGTSLMEEMPEISAVVGVDWLGPLKDAITSLESGSKYMQGPGVPRMTSCPRSVDSSDNATLLVRISDGCDGQCSFCTIPAIKGKHESRKPEDIVNEVREFSVKNKREVVLVGQDLTSYGKDLPGDINLTCLLRMISGIDNVHWIRLLYLQPGGLTEELLQEIMGNPKICNYFDLPFQHGEASVIKKMGRTGGAGVYLETIEKIRTMDPGSAVRTTVIVGFPGEGEEEFAELRAFVEKAGFDWLGVFCFCPEEGTKAAGYSGQVDHEEAVKRYNILLDIQEKAEFAKQESLIGRELEVVIDDRSDLNGYDFIGRSYREAPVVDGVIYLKYDEPAEAVIGEFRVAVITGREGLDLAGTVK